jgi:hypothetical protein
MNPLMQIPQFRLTIGRLMIGVAIAAILIAWCVENVRWQAFTEPSNPTPIKDYWPLAPDLSEPE